MKHVPADELAELSLDIPEVGELRPHWLEGPHTADRLDVGLMTLGPGGVTPPHVHLGGQVMVVVDGRGFVETEGTVVELGCGDVVICEPGELHTHGALEGESFAHLTVTTGTYTFPTPTPAD